MHVFSISAMTGLLVMFGMPTIKLGHATLPLTMHGIVQVPLQGSVLFVQLS